MKINTVIAGANGERIVTSTTETLRIPASEIRPGDWLLKHHRRGLAKDKLVAIATEHGRYMVVVTQLRDKATLYFLDQLVDVERTT